MIRFGLFCFGVLLLGSITDGLSAFMEQPTQDIDMAWFPWRESVMIALPLFGIYLRQRDER